MVVITKKEEIVLVVKIIKSYNRLSGEIAEAFKNKLYKHLLGITKKRLILPSGKRMY